MIFSLQRGSTELWDVSLPPPDCLLTQDGDLVFFRYHHVPSAWSMVQVLKFFLTILIDDEDKITSIPQEK